MKLVELYIQEVMRRLPEKNRDDIALELKSTIEDMLPDDYTEDDVREVLMSLGDPAVLASNYRDKPMHLIGPRYYDLYITLLKLIVPIAAAITFLVVTVSSVLNYSGDSNPVEIFLSIAGNGVVEAISAGMQVFFWLTVTFAVIERTVTPESQQPLTMKGKEWSPDDLKDVPYIPKEKRISKLEIFGGLVWTVIWSTCYFKASDILGLYEKSDGGRVFTPFFDQEVLLGYWPLIVILIGLELILLLRKWRAGVWTKRLAVENAVYQFVPVAVFLFIFRNMDVMDPTFIERIQVLFNNSFNFQWFYLTGAVGLLVAAVINSYDGLKKAYK
ncbi:HAAS signaling domain-containing protein [Rossellomorea oryzaecorticis]|uniref:HAAS signaling domain-containing protein n=1 Tax=Rossellomorea oryzaecorticis TaxID=1396505 RepID=A0ABW8VPX2_9BACI